MHVRDYNLEHYPRAAFNTRQEHLLNISLSETKVLYVNRDQENGQQVNHFPAGKKKGMEEKQEPLTVIRGKKYTEGGKKGCETSQIGRE